MPYSDRKEEKNCVVCGSKFIKQSINQKYCSQNCYKIAVIKREKIRKMKNSNKKNCLWCKCEFEPRPNRKFCSPECGLI